MDGSVCSLTRGALNAADFRDSVQSSFHLYVHLSCKAVFISFGLHLCVSICNMFACTYTHLSRACLYLQRCTTLWVCLFGLPLCICTSSSMFLSVRLPTTSITACVCPYISVSVYSCIPWTADRPCTYTCQFLV